MYVILFLLSIHSSHGSIRMGKKADLCDFHHGMGVGAKLAGLSISKTAHGIFTQNSL